MKNKDKNISAEMEMIKDLRKRVYGDTEASAKNKDSYHQCVFCGSDIKLYTYKNTYICHDCLSGIREENFEL